MRVYFAGIGVRNCTASYTRCHPACRADPRDSANDSSRRVSARLVSWLTSIPVDSATSRFSSSVGGRFMPTYQQHCTSRGTSFGSTNARALETVCFDRQRCCYTEVGKKLYPSDRWDPNRARGVRNVEQQNVDTVLPTVLHKPVVEIPQQTCVRWSRCRLRVSTLSAQRLLATGAVVQPCAVQVAKAMRLGSYKPVGINQVILDQSTLR